MRRRISMFALIVLAIAVARVDAQKVADEQTRRQALEQFRAGQALMSTEQFEPAAEAFSKAITKDNLLTVAHYGLGQANMGLRRFARAIKAYKDCIEATRSLHTLQQTNRFEVERHRDDEIRALKTVLNQASRNGRVPTLLSLEQRLRDLENQRSAIGGPFRPPAEVLLALGSAYFRNGNLEEAQLEWKAAIDANPKLGEAHNNLAVIYMQTGRLEAAGQELKLAEKAGFRVNPQFKEDLKKRKADR